MTISEGLFLGLMREFISCPEIRDVAFRDMTAVTKDGVTTIYVRTQ